MLCECHGLPLEVKKVDVASIAAEQGDGWEAAARMARYDFLQTAAERRGARFVVTAHTADDQAETVLHRVLRGTGLEGLAGMAKARPLTASVALVRPMLDLKRRDVLEYLVAIEQDYCEDATNQDTQWTRNRLRHELLPELRERHNAGVDDALVRLAVQAEEAQKVIAELAARIAVDCVVADVKRAKIDCGKVNGHPPIVVREVFRFAWRQMGWPEQAMGFAEWQQLAALAVGQDALVLNLPGNTRAHRMADTVELHRPAGSDEMP
jgi:tRNA(Ile)-lysidine synthase